MASETKNGSSAATTDIQIITKDGQEFTEVKEGLARILVPFSAKDIADKKSNAEEQQKVFYNPIQQFNRDLTVLAIKAYAEDAFAKRRAGNAERAAKRKREKTDTSGRNSKKEKVTENADGVTSTADDATKNGAQNNQPTPKFTILDALSATGLRALRYAQELPFVTSVTANDLSPSAVKAIKQNAEHNGVESKVNATSGDARAHMYSLLTYEVVEEKGKNKKSGNKPNKPNNKYNVIDLDPYGTAATFFDAALNAVRDDGGLLCVTCTDSGVFASHGYPEKTFALYGGIPAKGWHSHEVGLRLILHGLASTAARYGLAIEPLLSLSIDYYIRIFVKVRKSPAEVKFLAGKTMIVYSCDQGCGAWETQFLARDRKAPNASGKGVFYKHGLAMAPTTDRLCKECGSKMHLSGPMYGGPLHSPDFIKKILDDLPSASDEIYGTKTRIEGMLQTALEEFLTPPEDRMESHREDEFAAIEHYPFYFHPAKLAGTLHCMSPDEDSFRGALRSLGYEVTRSHCKGGSIKTNAPWSVIWHVMREWVREKAPVRVDRIKENTPAYTLLRLGKTDETPKEDPAKDAEREAIDNLKVVFDQKLGRDISKKGLEQSEASNLYDIFSLKEEPGDQEPTFRLFQSWNAGIPQPLLDEFLIEGLPDYLKSSPSRRIHAVVSTGSGTGLALKFYNEVVGRLLSGREVYPSDPTINSVEISKPNPHNLVVTQSADSVREFAREISREDEDGVQHTVVLLSGDGGVIEMLNGQVSVEGHNSEERLPLIAILPLGTGNALFHSLHKSAGTTSRFPAPSSLVQGLRTLFNGRAAALPSFKAEFSPGSRIITYKSPESSSDSVEEVESHADAVSHLYGAIVASYGFHSQLVWESDTPEYRKHGAKRFGMVAQQLLKESHAYNAIVELSGKDGSNVQKLDQDRHAYILATMVSNLEKTFTISPASKPLDGKLRLVHFGAVSGEKTMEIMTQAYNDGKHIGMKWTTEDGKEEGVGYEETSVVKITTLEEDARWRKVCIDGTIVELPQGGSMTIRTEDRPHLRVVVDKSLVR
ncbi:TRM-domain-containing protein [Daldinia loculata]|nr:TRM-domain-containing protein [Daldinia loculata]